MCKCAKNSTDILDAINDKRSRAGLYEVNLDWVIVKIRQKAIFMLPYRKIGPARVWDTATARKIVNAIWMLPYTPQSMSFRYARCG